MHQKMPSTSTAQKKSPLTWVVCRPLQLAAVPDWRRLPLLGRHHRRPRRPVVRARTRARKRMEVRRIACAHTRYRRAVGGGCTTVDAWATKQAADLGRDIAGWVA